MYPSKKIWLPEAARRRRERVLHVDFQRSNGLGKYPSTTTVTRNSEINAPDENGILQNYGANALASSLAGMHTAEGRANSFFASRSFDNATYWGVGTGSSPLPDIAKNATGIDGVANTAYTLTDSDNVNYEILAQTVTVANDSLPHCVSFYLKKNASTSYYPGATIKLSGGTTVQLTIMINMSTGATTATTTTGTVSHYVEAVGNWWRITLVATNNTTGNVTLELRIAPGFGVSWGTGNPTTTGSIVVDWAQAENGRFSTLPIYTTTSTATRESLDLIYACPQGFVNDYYVFMEYDIGFSSAENDFWTRAIRGTDASDTNLIEVYQKENNSAYRIATEGTFQETTDLALSRGDTVKLVMRKSSKLGTHLFINGVSAGWTSKTSNHSAISKWYMFRQLAGAQPMTCLAKRFDVYAGQISDERALAMSTV